MIPSATNEPTVSQGCCRPRIRMMSLFLFSYLASLIEGMILLEIEYPADFTLIDLIQNKITSIWVLFYNAR